MIVMMGRDEKRQRHAVINTGSSGHMCKMVPKNLVFPKSVLLNSKNKVIVEEIRIFLLSSKRKILFQNNQRV